MTKRNSFNEELRKLPPKVLFQQRNSVYILGIQEHFFLYYYNHNNSISFDLFIVESCIHLPLIDEHGFEWNGIYGILSIDRQQVRTDSVKPTYNSNKRTKNNNAIGTKMKIKDETVKDSHVDVLEILGKESLEKNCNTNFRTGDIDITVAEDLTHMTNKKNGIKITDEHNNQPNNVFKSNNALNIIQNQQATSPNEFLFSSPMMAPILLNKENYELYDDISDEEEEEEYFVKEEEDNMKDPNKGGDKKLIRINKSNNSIPTQKPKQLQQRNTNSNSSPIAKAIWNQEIIFDITKPLTKIPLFISVWGKNNDGDTHIIGTVNLDLSELKEVPIQKKSLRMTGGQLSPSRNDVNINDTSNNSSPMINIRLIYKKKKNKVTENDFEKLKVIGKGSFGKVYQVKKKDTGRIYAMKVLTKDYVVRNNAVKYAMAENRVLKNINHPFIVSLKYAFQTESHLYIVTDFLNGGEMFYHLTNDEFFSEKRAKFYAAEIVSALGYLHEHQILYRDLKPENILFDMDGHICLVDFGLCKDGLGNDFVTHTLCGSAEYLAPELLLGKGYGKEFDWWSLGILIYEMIAGLPPFFEEDEEKMQYNILHAPLVLTDDFSEDAKDIIRKLLNRDPKKRLGYGKNGTKDIQSHPWFKEYQQWDTLNRKEMEPPFKPHIFDEQEVKYVDEEILKERMSLLKIKKGKIPIEEDVFAGFSYDGESEMFKYFQSKLNSLKTSSESNRVNVKGNNGVLGINVGSYSGGSGIVGSYTGSMQNQTLNHQGNIQTREEELSNILTRAELKGFTGDEEQNHVESNRAHKETQKFQKKILVNAEELEERNIIVHENESSDMIFSLEK